MNADNTYTSPSVGATPLSQHGSESTIGIATKAIDQISLSSALLTLLISLILYDQGQQTHLFTYNHISRVLLTISSARYIWQKGSIEGPWLKTPFIGPFLESVNPKFEQYDAKWKSGPLSCVSVFHK